MKSLGVQYRTVMQTSYSFGAWVPILIRTTVADKAAKGAKECIMMHRGQRSISLAAECASAAWTDASIISKTKHTTIASRKAFGFGPRSLRKCVRIAVKATS